MTTCNHCGKDPASPRGLSASAIYHRRHGEQGTKDYPHDAGDFGRCVDYLGDTHPIWMRGVSPVWTTYVDHWGELLDLYDRAKPRYSSALTERLRALVEGARP